MHLRYVKCTRYSTRNCTRSISSISFYFVFVFCFNLMHYFSKTKTRCNSVFSCDVLVMEKLTWLQPDYRLFI
jgi:hypothetical protein